MSEQDLHGLASIHPNFNGKEDTRDLSSLAHTLCICFSLSLFFSLSLSEVLSKAEQTRVLPLPLGRRVRETKIQKWAPQTQKTLYFQGFLCSEGVRDHGLRPWSRKGPDHGVGVDLETVKGKCSDWSCWSCCLWSCPALREPYRCLTSLLPQKLKHETGQDAFFTDHEEGSQVVLLDAWHLIWHDLSAPNHKSQIASDLKSRSPNRKSFPQIAVSGSSNRTFKSRDLWFEPLFKSPLKSQCRFPAQVVRTMRISQKVHSVSNR